jgi:hypothetical protein
LIQDNIFYKIVIRRFDETTSPQINLNELQCWVNGSNIMVETTNYLAGYFAYWANKEVATEAFFYENVLRSVF